MSRIKYLFLLPFLFLYHLTTAQDLSGPWYGMLDLPDIELRVNLTVTETDSAYVGSIDLPDLEVSGIPVPGNAAERNLTLLRSGRG